VIIGIGLLSVYSSVEKTVEKMQEPLKIPVSSYREIPDPIKNERPISLLLLGIDERENDKGRTDTMIVVTVNPNKNTTKMISIPRDTYTKIIGFEKEDKINHAYAFGGIEMAKASVEDLLQIPIDYTISINMEGFIGLVDAVEGVDIENNLAFEVDDYMYELGSIHLQGEQALAFVRMRYDDPNGDFGRQERQKIVLDAVTNKLITLNSLWKYKELLGIVGENVRTNLSLDEMKTVSKNYKDALKDVESLSFQEGQGQIMQQIWYYMLDSQELKEIQNQLQTHLELAK
jgi:LCP family protein required for cell wall assembly